MEDISIVLLSISIAFFVLLAVKELFNEKLKKKFCVICIAITINWIVLFILYLLGIFENITIIAILMGETTLGVFYLAESKAREELKLFRLPFLLSLIVGAYYLLEPSGILNGLVVLSIIWLLFGAMYIFKKNEKLNLLAKKIIKCCKEW